MFKVFSCKIFRLWYFDTICSHDRKSVMLEISRFIHHKWNCRQLNTVNLSVMRPQYMIDSVFEASVAYKIHCPDLTIIIHQRLAQWGPETPYGRKYLGNTRSGNGLLSNGTEPLPDPIVTYHLCLMIFIWGESHNGYLSYQSVNLVWNYLSKT